MSENEINILFTGDFCPVNRIEKLALGGKFGAIFNDFIDILHGNDLNVTDLECPLTVGTSCRKKIGPHQKAHPECIEALKCGDIGLVALANNHIMDRDKEGLEETLDWLQRYRIHFIGAPLPAFAHSRNIKDYYFASEQSVFLAFNRVLPYIDYQEEIIKGIEKARQSNPGKIIIVSMHWGNEYQANSGIDERELAGKIVDAGADITIGHHPHVVWEIEMVKGKPVFYSLGNFIFDRQFLPQTREGLVIGLTISTDKLTFHLFPIKNQSG